MGEKIEIRCIWVGVAQSIPAETHLMLLFRWICWKGQDLFSPAETFPVFLHLSPSLSLTFLFLFHPMLTITFHFLLLFLVLLYSRYSISCCLSHTKRIHLNFYVRMCFSLPPLSLSLALSFPLFLSHSFCH
jgi:hypothetical protein